MTRAGGEVDDFCTRCRLWLAHTVIATVGQRPVKVECRTCHGVHAFRGTGAPAASPSRRRASLASFDEELAGRDVAGARRYSPRETYAERQVVDHPQFGRGFVSALREGGKMDVTFRSGVKTLVHGRRER